MRYSILLILLLAGCRADFSDIVTGAGASGAAAVASLMTSSPAIVASVTAGGALAGSIAVDDAPLSAADYGGEDGQINSFYELMTFAIANFMQYMIGIAIVIGVLWILAGYLGARKKRPEEKALESQINVLVDKIGKMKDN
tara:strand:+ start:410 stop:832 length:423 start_codon:yes stop_codon:yes gene_type:complete